MWYLVYHENERRGTFGFPIQLYYVNKEHIRYKMPFHWHMECEFIFVVRGCFFLSLDGKKISLHDGECAFVPPGVIHGGTPHDCVYEYVVVDVDHFLQGYPRCYGQYENTLAGGTYISSFFAAQNTVSHTIATLCKTMEEKQPGYEFITVGLLWQFIGQVLQQHLYALPTKTTLRIGTRISEIKRALQYIWEHYADQLTLQNMAAVANMAPQYFCRVFKSITGQTPIAYLNYFRIECAAELLCASQNSVTEIALSCGFTDLSYFIRQFKRYKGTSPGVFRKSFALS